MLGCFHSGGTIHTQSRLYRLILFLTGGHPPRQVANRVLTGLPSSKVVTHPFPEIRMAFDRLRGKSPHEAIFDRNLRFQKTIPADAIRMSDAVIGYDTSSYRLAEFCHEYNVPFYLDRTIAFSKNRSLDDPIAPTLTTTERMEHDFAKRIIVPSTFVKQSLVSDGIDQDKIITIPYGVDLEQFSPDPRRRQNRPLKFIFAGTLGERKGVPELLAAWSKSQTNKATLTLRGKTHSSFNLPTPLPSGVQNPGPLNRDQMARELRAYDVMVLPSHSEGFALVILEALASGLPVICTPSSGAENIIRNHEQGMLVPAGSVEALKEAIEFFVRHPDLLCPMSKAARLTAEQFSWSIYGKRWQELLQTDLGRNV
jgi:starch synthase